MSWKDIIDYICLNIRAINIPIPNRPLKVVAIYFIKKKLCQRTIAQEPIRPPEPEIRRKEIEPICQSHRKNLEKWTKQALKFNENQGEKRR